ncbi:HlyD family efflux transporter periplasmic adaptor subunit [Dyella japonica]|uniref:Peptidase M50 n=1 Tax=Dyella japonica DSM 16301 TaxID=1440762 RepID=A0A0G9H552_9GAMM|nr:HlyD family efflux transporter periplasmic adaptor subunit [Dyella japonica]KLD64965.1 peptidase M50 [Dyella japonica DSM 16301]
MESVLDMPLPPLRDDLQLSEASAGREGEPAWVIQDSVVNRFYRIGWLEFECLLRWGSSPREIADDIQAKTTLQPDAEQVWTFGLFLQHNHLLRPGPAAVEQLRKASEGTQWLTWRWWLHHYLFFRIPLLRPERLLRFLAAHTDWLFNRITAAIIIVLSLLGILMVAHQWDEFTHAVVDAFSFEGVLGFALAIIIGKTLHELGHAVVATRLGVRVAHMGIAFVVMWPMLYTDTGEAWKLRSSRQRLAIASAGVLTELTLAGLSTFLWALSEPGTLRNALLYLATTNWALTLALNASPFTRFDGYFILSDLLDVPNLHERASALARVAVRRHVLGLDEPWPEVMDARRRHMLIGFAFVTWVYRFALFLGIAVAVYYFFFKALGIVLFAVEVTWFIGLPIARELRHWWSRRSEVPVRRRMIVFAIIAIILVLIALPWRTQVHAYAVARSAQQQRIFAPFAARIRDIHASGEVAAGTPLVVLEQPDIAIRMRGSQSSLQGYQAQLSSLLAQPGGIDQQSATTERVNVQLEEVASARDEIARLTLRAPFAGRWMDVNPDWKPGQWIKATEPLGVIADPQRWQVDAYVPQEDIYRIQPGAEATFFADGHVGAIHGRVISIASSRSSQLDHAMLSSRYGGPIAVAKKADSDAPSSAFFLVVIQLDGAPYTVRELRGHAQIEGERRSYLMSGLTRLLSAVIKQSGF